PAVPRPKGGSRAGPRRRWRSPLLWRRDGLLLDLREDELHPHRRLADAVGAPLTLTVAGTILHVEEDGRVARLRRLQRGDEFDRVVAVHARIGLGRDTEESGVAHAGKDLVVGRVAVEVADLIRILRGTVLVHPKLRDEEALEANHVVEADPSHRDPEEVEIGRAS